MERNLCLAFAGLFLLLFFGMAWFGVSSVARRLDMTHMESNFRAAEEARHGGRKKFAAQAYRAAVVKYRRGLSRGGYYPVKSGESLTAGNCYWQRRQPRAALQCYEEGLRCEPFSISLLSSLGSCAYHLGESEKALVALEKSSSIYPLKKEMRLLLRKLRTAKPGEGK